jgi:hypothetical protein
MLSGNLNINARQKLWNEKRIFFCTPQTLHNDVNRGTCDISDFVLLVVDEAHRATGNYAYTHITKTIMECKDRKRGPRIVALSATPGSKLDKVAEVIENLYISKVEVRAADDEDVKEYVHGRQVPRTGSACTVVLCVCTYVVYGLLFSLSLSLSRMRTTPHHTPQEELIVLGHTKEVKDIMEFLDTLMQQSIGYLAAQKAMAHMPPDRINFMQLKTVRCVSVCVNIFLYVHVYIYVYTRDLVPERLG